MLDPINLIYFTKLKMVLKFDFVICATPNVFFPGNVTSVDPSYSDDDSSTSTYDSSTVAYFPDCPSDSENTDHSTDALSFTNSPRVPSLSLSRASSIGDAITLSRASSVGDALTAVS